MKNTSFIYTLNILSFKCIKNCHSFITLLQSSVLTNEQWRLQDFFVGGAKGGLNSSEGVIKSN